MPQGSAWSRGFRGPKKDQIERTRVDACGRFEGPFFRGKPGGEPFFRAGRFPPYTASIPAASIPRSPAPSPLDTNAIALALCEPLSFKRHNGMASSH